MQAPSLIYKIFKGITVLSNRNQFLLFTLLLIQITCTLYLVINSLHRPPQATYSASEFKQIIQTELQVHLQKLKNIEEHPVATSITIDKQLLHATLRSTVQEEIAVFFNEFQSTLNGATHTGSNQVAIHKPLSIDQADASNTSDIPQMSKAAIDNAMTDSNAVIDAALAAGVWLPEDTLALMSYTAELPAENMHEIRIILLDIMTRDDLMMEGIIPFL